MKKFLLCCFLGISASFSSNLLAIDDTMGEPQSQTTRLYITNNPKRSRNVDINWIDCYYSYGELIFNSNKNIEDLNIYITKDSTGMISYYYISGIDQAIQVQLNQDTYYILCETREGYTYEGVLVVE